MTRCHLPLALLLFSTAAPGHADDGAKQRHWLQATAYAVPKETATEGEGYFSIIEGHNGGCTSAPTPTASTPGWSSSTRGLEEDDDGRRRAQGDRHRTPRASRPRPRSTRATTSAPAARFTSAPSRATPTRTRSARTIPAATRWSTTPKRARRRSTPSPCRTRASTASRPTSRAASPTSPPAPTTGPGPARTRLPHPRPEDRQVPRPDRHAAHLRLHRRRPPGPGVSPASRRRTSPATTRRPISSKRLKQTIDGKPPTADSHLADPKGHPINWDISPDGKTLYCCR